MKTIQIFLIALLFTLTQSAFSEDYYKVYRNEYKTDAATLVVISNKFGNVDVQNWEKSAVSISVKVTVDASNQQKADELFRKITIKMENTSNIVRAITEMEDMNNNRFHIDYTIQMPKDLKLNLENRFGDVVIAELIGKCNITVKYGSLLARKILGGESKPRSEICLAYCNPSRIDEVNWLKLSESFTKNLEIGKAVALIAECKFSELRCDFADAVVCDLKHSTLKAVEFNKFVCTSEFCTVDIRKLNTKLELETKHSGIQISSISKNFENISVVSEFTKCKLGIEVGASYKLDGKAEFCEIKYPQSGKLNRVKENTSMKVWGNIGSDNSPSRSVIITTKFGDVELTKN